MNLEAKIEAILLADLPDYQAVREEIKNGELSKQN